MREPKERSTHVEDAEVLSVSLPSRRTQYYAPAVCVHRTL
jgi:hypothetical protein